MTQQLMPIMFATIFFLIILLELVGLRGKIRALNQQVNEMQKRLDRGDRDLAEVERRLGGELQRQIEQNHEHQTFTAANERRLDQLTQALSALQQDHGGLAKKVDALGAATPAPEAPSVEENAQDLIASDLAQRVLTQLRAGETPAEIARREGVQVGEIMLIKSLFSSEASS